MNEIIVEWILIPLKNRKYVIDHILRIVRPQKTEDEFPKPLSLEDHIAVLRKRTKDAKCDVDDTTLEYLCRKVGWSCKESLEMLLDEAMRYKTVRLMSSNTKECLLAQEDVDLAYKYLVSSNSHLFYKYDWVCKNFTGYRLTIALDILKHIARSPSDRLKISTLKKRLNDSGKDLNYDIDHVLKKLYMKGYLIENSGYVQFVCPILSEYWENNYA